MAGATTITPVSPGADLGAHFAEHGVVHVANLLNKDEIDQLRTAFTEQVERDNSIGHNDNVPKDDILSRYPRFIHPHRRPDLEVGRLSRQFLLDRRILEKVEAMIGPANAAQSMFYFKPPSARGQSMHQDNFFLRSYPETCLAVWIAIDKADDVNGALRMVPGSHRYELICPQEEADQDQSFSRQAIHLPSDVTLRKTDLEAGDALFFNGSMVHGSGPNETTDRFRRSLIFHFIPQTSVEIANFYMPLLSPTGKEIYVRESANGGVCGEAWGVPVTAH